MYQLPHIVIAIGIIRASKNMDIKSQNMAIKYGPKITKYGQKYGKKPRNIGKNIRNIDINFVKQGVKKFYVNCCKKIK
jgi:hypothetical protein